MIARIKSGIKGIDGMIQGGLPKNSVISAEGPAGVGKSIMALQFLYEGAKNNEKSVYLNLEEPRENIDNTLNSLAFGKEFYEFEKKGKIIVLCLTYEQFETEYDSLFKKIKKDKKIKRLVIDSYNCFFSYLSLENISKSGYEIRKILSQSFNLFRNKEMNTLLLLELENEHNSLLNHYVRYMVDGIIHLDYLSLGTIERRVFIPKMRWTSQHDSSLIFTISKKGIIVKEE